MALDEDLYEKIFSLMPPERRKKYGRGIKTYRYEGVACYALLLFAACAKGLKRKELTFSYEKNGKPMIDDFFFNFSHCSDCVICAVSDGPVGADIQAECKASLSVINKYCTPGEQEKLKAGMPFNRLWTQKEAIVKYTGEGIAALEGLCDLSGYSDDGISYETPCGTLFTEELGTCAVSVCSDDKDTRLVQVTPDMLWKMINGLT